MASVHSASHTLKFTAVTVNSAAFTKTSFGEQQNAVNSKGKLIGFSVVYITLTGKTSATLYAALDTTGGFLYATLTSTNLGKTSSGTVTGGTGAFKGATGTVTAKTISSTKTAVAIIYK